MFKIEDAIQRVMPVFPAFCVYQFLFWWQRHPPAAMRRFDPARLVRHSKTSDSRMQIVIGRTGIIFACSALLLAGCASTPHSPTSAPTTEVTHAADARAQVYPTLQFIAGDHRYELYGLNASGVLDERAYTKSRSSMLVFEDERLLGTLDGRIALVHLACFAQAGGSLLLAVRLRSLTTDHPDKVHRLAHDGQLCPWKPDRPPTEDEAIAMVEAHEWTDAQPAGVSDPAQGTRKPMSTGKKAAIVAGGAILLACPPLLAFLVVEAAGNVGARWATDETFAAIDGAIDHARLVAQRKIELGMGTDALAKLLGKPISTFDLNSTSLAGSRVLFYRLGGATAIPLWVGIADERVAWVLHGDLPTQEWGCVLVGHGLVNCPRVAKSG